MKKIGVLATTVSLICSPAVAAETGDELLEKGLEGRTTTLSSGIKIQRKNNLPDAGYFLVRIVDRQLDAALKCPKKAFKSDSGKKWRGLNDSIHDLVFARKGIWGINAKFGVSNPENKVVWQEARLLSIKNPHKKSCVPVAMGANEEETMPQFTFIVPINVNDHRYGTRMDVILKSVHELEPKSDRVDALWGGLGFFAKVVSAPLAPLVEKFSGEGKKEVTNALTNTAGESNHRLKFEANPQRVGVGDQYTKSEFVYLGFSDFGQTGPQAGLKGGVELQADYLASVLTGNGLARYYSELSKPDPSDVLAAQAFDNGKTVAAQLGDTFNFIKDVKTPEDFSNQCTALRPIILKTGLSEVDTDLWFWALASANQNSEVSKNLHKIGCLKTSKAKRNLARVANIQINDPIIKIVPKRIAKYKEMHSAMDNLGLLASSGALNDDLMTRFASKLNFSIADPVLSSRATALIGKDKDRGDVLKFIVENFSSFGCFSPRNDDVNYQMRPFMQLSEKGRAGSFIMKGADERVFAISLGFDGVPERGDKDAAQSKAKAIVSSIAIDEVSNDGSPLIEDLRRGSSKFCPSF